ncbi:MAG: ABC transporter ATP-binding protein [Candidatus Moranbacteria bacterium]|jgi:putative ABC transport system ATP-binding protein|nr:ABC transporter ATP-binding protein [Candidatus Moranbacteria bacterium]
MENEVLIKLNNVELTYNDGKPNAFRALQGINLEIKKNSFVIIFGPSGCGKSSLLNVISGLEKPDKGDVFVSGNDLVKMSQGDHVKFHRDTIGMVFQSYNLITTLSVLDNVAIPQVFTSNRKSAREEKALSLLERFGIRPQADKLPSELSGGQQQRIGIARAIINDQPIILADEPVGNLDSKSANNVMQIMSELNKDENKTIVMVSHNPENIIWGDHIIYMKDGRIIKEDIKNALGETMKIRKDEEDEFTKLEAMLRNFEGLSREQIKVLVTPMKSEILTRAVIIDMDEKQIEGLEETIRRRILNTITPGEFFEKLDKTDADGGIDMDIRTAHRIAKKVEDVIALAHIVNDKYLEDDDYKSRAVLKYLLTQDNIKVAPNQVEKLKELIINRITMRIDRSVFRDLLDKPIIDNGAGFNRKTAKKIAKTLDMILMIGYGS